MIRASSTQVFTHGQFVNVCLDELSKADEKLSALKAWHLLAPDSLEGLAGGSDGNVNVLGGCLGDLGNLLASGRVDGAKGLAILCSDPFVAVRRRREEGTRLSGRLPHDRIYQEALLT